MMEEHGNHEKSIKKSKNSLKSGSCGPNLMIFGPGSTETPQLSVV